MKNYLQTKNTILGMILACIMLFVPSVSFAAAPPPGTLIPCGYDLNSDGKVLDTPPITSGTWAVGNHEECYFEDVITLAQTVVNFLIFSIASPLAAVMFAYAGFLYLTNRGNESQVKQAHDIFLYVFWGLVVALGAWIFVNFILEFFLLSGSGFNYLS